MDKEAEKAALISGDSLSIVKSKRVKAHLLRYLNRYGESRAELLAVLPVAIRNAYKKELCMIYHGLSLIYLYSGDYDKALQRALRTMDLAIELNDSLELSNSLHQVGLIYYKLKAYRKALDFYNRSIVVNYDESTEYFKLANIGLCYAYLGDYKTARQ